MTREQLFPIKVGFNVGEWNWEEASALCSNASIHAILLLDWLEHLREPLLSSQLVEKLLYVAPVPPLKLPAPKTTNPATMHHARSESETHGNSSSATNSNYRFQQLHQLPAYAMRSLDRVLSCLRVLEAKLEQFATGDILFDAVCVRTAMALFHLSTTSCSTSSLRRHADCIALLIDKWHAPKRLELNLDTLQKLSIHRPSTCRLTQSASTLGYNSESGESATPPDEELSKPHSPSRSPTRSVLTPTSSPTRSLTMSPTSSPQRTPRDNLPGMLSEDIPIPDSLLQTQTTDSMASFSPPQPHKPQGEAHPRPNIASVTITSTSPRPSPRSSSPIKIDPLPTSFNRREEEEKKEEKSLALPSSPSSSPKVDLSPLPPQPVPDKESELSDDSFAISLAAELTNPPALPSVRDGGRYSRRAGK